MSLHTPLPSLASRARPVISELPLSAPDTPALARWLQETLDHVGRGMLLVTAGARVLHANRQARQALQSGHALVIEEGRLRGSGSRDDGLLADALEGAMRRGLRRMLSLGETSDPVTVAVLPIDAEGGGAALVSLSQPSRSQDLAVHCFARQHGYTSAETSVLEALLSGERPADIARAKGVALSTVRTQIGQLRLKTGAHSIRQLLDRVASLPPMMAVVQ
jgi:DNA-binding CsgD family transcriptional regulator